MKLWGVGSGFCGVEEGLALVEKASCDRNSTAAGDI